MRTKCPCEGHPQEVDDGVADQLCPGAVGFNVLLLSLMLLDTSNYKCILFGNDTDEASSDFVVDDRLVVFNAEFLTKNGGGGEDRVETYDVAI
jgi:hypothetical protein